MSATPASTVRWTPAEGWLIVELAKRSLSATVDGNTQPFRLDVANTEDLALALDFDVATITLQLDLEHSSGHRWRGHWLLELSRGDERWVLSAETPVVTITDADRGQIHARPRLRHRALARELADGVETVPIKDVACHRYTRQSTVRSQESELAPWAAPTEREAAPWWELDLAKSLYVPWLRIDLDAPPAGTRIVVRAYAFLSPALEPPADSIVFEAYAEQIAVHAGRVAIAIAEATVARYIRIELVAAGEPVALVVTSAEVLAAELVADTLEATLRRSFAVFCDRPLFVERDGTPIATYREIWDRAMAFSRGLAKRIEPIADNAEAPSLLRGRGVLAVITRSRPEWLIADLAGLVRGYVSVPLSPDESDERLAFVLSRAPATCIVCERADAARFAKLAPAALIVACD
ncbi:MAG: AMP-binding protein, partial [Deltaproteobacteria bacterium]|nr:AMP-binding protein [Deltaproteobacteria bacterium]